MADHLRGRQRWARRCVFFLALAIVVIVVISCKEFYHQWAREARCIQEIQHGHQPIQIEGNTKEELVEQFIRIYDVNLNVTSSGHLAATVDSWMTCRQVHHDYEPRLGAVLKWLSTTKITKAVNGLDGLDHGDPYTGHTPKLTLHLEGGFKLLFKVQRYDRDEISGSIAKHRFGWERHNGEIASYHLQRILGFNRAPIAVGRSIDLTRELLPVADEHIKNSVVQNDGTTCFNISKRDGILGNIEIVKTSCMADGKLEGVAIVWLPRELRMVSYYSLHTLWNRSAYFTAHVNGMYPFVNDDVKRLDFIDSLLFDYMIQNTDRHAVFFDPASFSASLLLDHGKSFDDPHTDANYHLDVFAQRCQLRKATYTRLKLLQGGVLGTVLRHILSRDPIAPVLWELHYKALDRRLENILNVVQTCLDKHGSDYVLLEDNLPSETNRVTPSSTVWVHYRWWTTLHDALWSIKHWLI